MKRPPEDNIDLNVEYLEILYQGGDYKKARALAARLMKSPELTNNARARVEKIAASMKTDKAALVAFGFTFLVLLYLVAKYGM